MPWRKRPGQQLSILAGQTAAVAAPRPADRVLMWVLRVQAPADLPDRVPAGCYRCTATGYSCGGPVLLLEIGSAAEASQRVSSAVSHGCLPV